MNFDAKVITGLEEGRMYSLGDNPANVSDSSCMNELLNSHLWFRNSAFGTAFLSGCKACHENGFRATTGGHTSTVRGSVEEGKDL